MSSLKKKRLAVGSVGWSTSLTRNPFTSFRVHLFSFWQVFCGICVVLSRHGLCATSLFVNSYAVVPKELRNIRMEQLWEMDSYTQTVNLSDGLTHYFLSLVYCLGTRRVIM